MPSLYVGFYQFIFNNVQTIFFSVLCADLSFISTRLLYSFFLFTLTYVLTLLLYMGQCCQCALCLAVPFQTVVLMHCTRV